MYNINIIKVSLRATKTERVWSVLYQRFSKFYYLELVLIRINLKGRERF